MDTGERERLVSPSSAIGGDYQAFIDEYLRASVAAVAKADPPCRLHLQVPQSGHFVDVFDPPAEVGVRRFFVYIHGGYWQELDREHSRFAGASLQKIGWGLVVVGYPLAPLARLGEMVEVVNEAIRWTRSSLHGDVIVVGGSSAGAHLAAMAAPKVTIDGLVLVSGVYDLAPLRGTSVDTALQLTAQEVKLLSPLWLLPALVPTYVAVGGIETEWFIEMSSMYADHLRAHDVPVTDEIFPQRNHFDIVHELQDPNSTLLRWLIACTPLRDQPHPISST